MAGATGFEPDSPCFHKRLMARDFGGNFFTGRRFPPSILSTGVLSRPLESTPVMETFWRRGEPPLADLKESGPPQEERLREVLA